MSSAGQNSIGGRLRAVSGEIGASSARILIVVGNAAARIAGRTVVYDLVDDTPVP